jgi:hypothetical protein
VKITIGREVKIMGLFGNVIKLYKVS